MEFGNEGAEGTRARACAGYLGAAATEGRRNGSGQQTRLAATLQRMQFILSRGGGNDHLVPPNSSCPKLTYAS